MNFFLFWITKQNASFARNFLRSAFIVQKSKIKSSGVEVFFLKPEKKQKKNTNTRKILKNLIMIKEIGEIYFLATYIKKRNIHV